MEQLTKTESAIAGRRVEVTMETLLRAMKERAESVVAIFDFKPTAETKPDRKLLAKVMYLSDRVVDSGEQIILANAIISELWRVATFIDSPEDNHDGDTRKSRLGFSIRRLTKEVVCRQSYAANSTRTMPNIRNVMEFQAKQHVLALLQQSQGEDYSDTN